MGIWQYFLSSFEILRLTAWPVLEAELQALHLHIGMGWNPAWGGSDSFRKQRQVDMSFDPDAEA